MYKYITCFLYFMVRSLKATRISYSLRLLKYVISGGSASIDIPVLNMLISGEVSMVEVSRLQLY